MVILRFLKRISFLRLITSALSLVYLLLALSTAWAEPLPDSLGSLRPELVEGPITQSSMRLYVIESGYVKAGALCIPINAYLIGHPSGWVLFDAGFDPSWSRLYKVLPEKIKKHLPITIEENVSDQIRKIGLIPDDIKYVIVSHFHYDHIGGLDEFKNAKIVISKKEWRNTSRNIFSLLAHGYIPSLYRRVIPRIYYIDYLIKGRRYSVFPKTFDLFGDKNIILVETPGHTAGHQSLILDFGGDKKIMLLGDAAYTLEEVDSESLPRGLFSLGVEDKNKEKKTLKLIKMFKERETGTRLIPNHDPRQREKLKTIPDFYTVENFIE